jgi:hypothetical protein
MRDGVDLRACRRPGLLKRCGNHPCRDRIKLLPFRRHLDVTGGHRSRPAVVCRQFRWRRMRRARVT